MEEIKSIKIKNVDVKKDVGMELSNFINSPQRMIMPPVLKTTEIK